MVYWCWVARAMGAVENGSRDGREEKGWEVPKPK